MSTIRTVLAALIATGGLATAAVAAPPPVAPPASPSPALVDAVIQVVDKVCRPAADSQTSPAGFAVQVGYTHEATAPPNLPVGTAALDTWRAPSPEGRVYVMSGLFQESTTPSTCLVAIYDAKTAGLTEKLGQYVLGLKRGFEINPRYDITTGGQHLTRYDRRVGDTLHSVVILDAVEPKAGQPVEVFSAFVVDYGWMLHPSKAHP